MRLRRRLGVPWSPSQVECRSIEGDVGILRDCRRDCECSGVVVLRLVPIDVLPGDRKEIVDDDAGAGLELE